MRQHVRPSSPALLFAAVLVLVLSSGPVAAWTQGGTLARGTTSSPAGSTTRSGQPAAQGADCAPLLVNGDFETGTAGAWTQTSGSGESLVSNQFPHGGSYGAWLGGYDDAEDTLNQAIILPAEADSISLVLWWAIHTQEETHPHDVCTVELRDEVGNVIAALQTITDGEEADVWSRSAFDLSPFKGRTLRLAFHAVTNSTGPTDFFFDDVSVQACLSQPTLTPTATATPTVTTTPGPTEERRSLFLPSILRTYTQR